MKTDTRGFTMVEVLVALVLVSLCSVGLGRLMFQAARMARVSGSVTYQTAAMSAEVARLDAVPFDSVGTGTSCVTVSTPPFPHTRCTTVNNISSKVKQVIVVVTPSGNTLLHPDTTTVVRTKNGNGAPLNQP